MLVKSALPFPVSIIEEVMIAPKTAFSKNSAQEEILLCQLRQGDCDAFWKLWHIHRDYLYARCRVWMGGNYFDAEEAISLAALKAWSKLPKYASSSTNLRGWLTRLTYNLCIDLHRQRQRQALSTDNIEDTQHSLQEICNSSVSNPEAVLLQKELNIYLRYCIEKLPSRLRYPLILCYYHEMTCVEIGQKLSITQNNVSKRLQEARAVLKDYCQQYSAGLDKIPIDEVYCQELEQKNFQSPINIEPKVEEISYTVTISCLENLSPVWCNSPQIIDWL